MQVQKQQLELDMEQQTGSKLGKKDVKASHCLFNLYAEYIIWNAGLYEAQAGLGEISVNSEMQMIPSLWQKVKRN